MEEMGYVPRFILGQSRAARNVMIIGLFTGGGLILYFTVHPFLESLKTLALSLGVSAFVFVQWFAPFLSEFPEKVSAFKWARRVTTAPMGLMNMVSSNINQWTMLVAMLPVAFATGLGHWETIAFDQHQKAEIPLTISQSLAGAMLFARMRFAQWEAVMLFLLWMLQFILSGFEKPIDQTMAHNALAEHLAAWLAMTVDQLESIARGGKEIITVLYFAWTAIIISVAMKRRSLFEAIAVFPRLLREHR
jgi:cation:H+ antiporter